jgi:hypothetical protein
MIQQKGTRLRVQETETGVGIARTCIRPAEFRRRSDTRLGRLAHVILASRLRLDVLATERNCKTQMY